MHTSATTSRRPRVHRPGLAVVVGLVLVLSAAGGCSSSDGDDAATTSTTAVAPGATTEPTTAETACISRMPGEILTAEEAAVTFTPERVCPGYVTIAPGTPVTFRNDDDVAHTVTIADGNLPDGAPVAEQSVEPGASWVQPFDAAGVFSYVTDAIPSFRGTVDVVADPA